MADRNRTTRPNLSRLPGGPSSRRRLWREHRDNITRGLGLSLLLAAIWALLIPWGERLVMPAVGAAASSTVRARATLEVSIPNPDSEKALAAARASARPIYAWAWDAAERFGAAHRPFFLTLRRQHAQPEIDAAAIRSRTRERVAPLLEERRALEEGTPEHTAVATRIAQIREAERMELERIEREVAKLSEQATVEAMRLYNLRRDSASKMISSLKAAGFPAAFDVVVEDAVAGALRRPIVKSLEDFQQALLRGVDVQTPDGARRRWSSGDESASPSRPWASVRDLDGARNHAIERAEEALGRYESLSAQGLQSAIVEAVATSIQPTLTLDPKATSGVIDKLVASVPRYVERTWRAGDVIVRRRGVVDRMTQAALQAERERRSEINSFWPRLGALFIVLVVSVLAILLQTRIGTPPRRTRPILLLWCMTLLLTVATIRGWFLLVRSVSDGFLELSAESVALAIPLAWAPMTVGMFTHPARALGLIIAALALGSVQILNATNQHTLSSGGGLLLAMVVIAGSVAGLLAVRRVRARNQLIRAALAVCIAQALMAFGGTLAIEGSGLGGAAECGLAAAVSGVLSYLLITAMVPIYEWLFRLPTDLKLLELGDMNQPLLRQLSMTAPGTYNHSLRVAELSERAAEAIGGHGLLCRVGAYYHDIGKSKNPPYFAENQEPGRNPHDCLQPSMSALIVRAHVKDGIEMAKRTNLPEDIIDFIPEHHGTAVITYFHHRAQAMAEQEAETAAWPGRLQEVALEDYRHIGPAPQRRETAIVMLADSVEAATRSVPDPTAPKIAEVVRNIIREKFLDGQLDRCDLTLRDLDAIAAAFVSVLRSMHHQRPQYPESPITGIRMTGENEAPESDETRDTDPPVPAEA